MWFYCLEHSSIVRFAAFSQTAMATSSSSSIDLMRYRKVFRNPMLHAMAVPTKGMNLEISSTPIDNPIECATLTK